MKKYKVGYTQGVFDMFHIGHLNLINNAKKQCSYLMVGVNSDRLVQEYKNVKPHINENDREIIVNNIKAVNQSFIIDTLDKLEVYKMHKFDVIFIGDDWQGNPRRIQTEEVLKRYGVDVVYLPYTKGVSSTILRDQDQ